MYARPQPGLGIRRLIAAGLLMATLSVPSSASAQQPTVRFPAVAQRPLGPDLPPRPGSTLERHFDSLRLDFIQLDADRDGKITQRDVDLHVLMEAVASRNATLMSVMRFDLDGDGEVTEDEVRRSQRYYLRSSEIEFDARTDSTVQSIMALDTDKNGKVSFSEAGKLTPARGRLIIGSDGLPERTRRVLTLKSATKGEIARSDYEAAGEAVFRKIDTDSNGIISQQELDDYRKTR